MVKLNEITIKKKITSRIHLCKSLLQSKHFKPEMGIKITSETFFLRDHMITVGVKGLMYFL